MNGEVGVGASPDRRDPEEAYPAGWWEGGGDCKSCRPAQEAAAHAAAGRGGAHRNRVISQAGVTLFSSTPATRRA